MRNLDNPSISTVLPLRKQNAIEIYMQALRRHGTALALFVILSCLLTATGSYLITPTYEATTTILPRQQARGGLAGLLAGGLGALGEMAGNGLPLNLLSGAANNTPLDLRGILESRSLTERVIKSLQLERLYPKVGNHDELVAAIFKLREIRSPDLRDPFISITAHAADPALAANLANAYVAQLDRYLQQINYSQGRKSRRFIEARLPLVNAKLDLAAQQLTSFQKANKTLAMPTELQESIKTLGQLEAQQLEARLESTESSAALSATSERMATLKGVIDQPMLTAMISRKEAAESRQRVVTEALREFQSQLAALPEKAVRFAYLQREYTVQEALYTLLSQQRELALIAESQEPDVFSIVDRATAPYRPVKPNRRVLVFSAFIASLLLGNLFCWWLEWGRLP